MTTVNRPPKKTETVEIRLPHAVKSAFMDRCRAQGRTASDAIRGFIDAELRPAGSRPRVLGWRALLAAAVAGLALGAAAAPSLAETSTSDRAAFGRLDRDGDGQLSLDEFRLR